MIAALAIIVDADAPARPVDAPAPWSLSHLLVLAFTVVSLALLVWVGRRGPRHDQPAARRDAIGLSLGCMGLAILAASWGYWLLFRPFDLQRSLPLHWCDIAGLLAPLALITAWRPLRAAGFYWSLAFTTQAFFAPVVDEPPSTLRWWLYWLSHWAILACATYDFWARGYRPRWRDCLLALLCCYIFLIVVVPFVLISGTNYGYVGRTKPGVPSPIDFLGAWPWRAIWMVALGHVVFVVLTVLAQVAPSPRPASQAKT